MKNVCNFDLAYAIFLHEQKYLHQVSLYIFTKKKKKKEFLTCLRIYKSI